MRLLQAASPGFRLSHSECHRSGLNVRYFRASLIDPPQGDQSDHHLKPSAEATVNDLPGSVSSGFRITGWKHAPARPTHTT
jgi:hypothetical protein